MANHNKSLHPVMCGPGTNKDEMLGLGEIILGHVPRWLPMRISQRPQRQLRNEMRRWCRLEDSAEATADAEPDEG
jgi:hypothetical protein